MQKVPSVQWGKTDIDWIACTFAYRNWTILLTFLQIGIFASIIGKQGHIIIYI